MPNNSQNGTNLVQRLGTKRAAACAGELIASANARAMHRFKKAARRVSALGVGRIFFILRSGRAFPQPTGRCA